MIRLAVFLGNYGAQYKRNRHNVAWLFEEALALGWLSWQEKFKGQYAAMEYQRFLDEARRLPELLNSEGQLVAPKEPPERIFFLKPLTYMNLSGEAIAALGGFFKIAPEEILVLHDELELPLGTFGLKWSGGLAGHNGLRSTKACLGTADFWRMRFGISKPAGVDIASYVLSDFRSEEAIFLGDVFARAKELFMRVLLASEPSRLLPKWSKIKVEKIEQDGQIQQ